MKLTVTGQHLDIGSNLRQYVESNINEITEKYFVNPVGANVVITKEKKNYYSVDITLQLGSGVVLQAEDTAEEVYPAFESAARIIAKRLSRYKDRLKDHHKKMPVHEVVANYSTIETEQENEAEGGNEPAIIAETAMKIQTLAVADAVMLLELSQSNAMMFKNPANGRLNMVYRRRDGNIGWVDPEYSDIVSKQHIATKSKPAKKSAVKKAPAKKTSAKKAVQKKSTVKKVVAKKTPAKKVVKKTRRK